MLHRIAESVSPPNLIHLGLGSAASLALPTNGYIKALPAHAVQLGEWLGSTASLALVTHGYISIIII